MTQRLICPKWAGCDAPVCPIDPGHAQCHTHNGEPVCLWLREAVKDGGMQRIPIELVQSIREALPRLLGPDGGSALRTSLKRAATKGSKVTREAPQRYVTEEIRRHPGSPAANQSDSSRGRTAQGIAA